MNLYMPIKVIISTEVESFFFFSCGNNGADHGHCRRKLDQLGALINLSNIVLVVF